MASPFDPKTTGITTTNFGGGSAGQAGYFTPPTQQPGRRTRQRTNQAWDYQSSGQTPWGPANGPTSGYSAQPGQSAQPPQAKTPGVLSGPGHYEQFYDKFKNDPNRGYFNPRQKSYTEELYESGNQGLNKYYQQARDTGQQDLSDRLASMGLLGSGATALAVGNLDAKLGAQQSRDMAGLAQAADTAGSNRLSDYWSGTKSEGDLADRAQQRFETRERYPLQDKRQNAQDMAGIFERFSSANTNEQRELFEQVVQAGIASGAVDRQAAEQQAEDMFRMYGIGIRAADMRSGTGTGYPVSNPDILPPSR